ncbi:MGDG synthase family glycosyltransferase [Paenibacillus rhizophilus]|uniref:Diacylglycerol glucosyltransferase N-terminal domain-containing protein n=1 Tax=Paenibacillus rhizophilus TaxID=1850366 RepID=A0A3N9Q7U4_9BACL|nr:UDP-N-acetylglucosamine 2-epimerase [Paenibacillus rhizophilus]RQW13596.1 hypothetical protein EH198_04095 [Paenibacillus rhizophilus]
MNPDPVVLIVSSAFGDGHAKVAQAIEQSFKSRGVDRVHTVDLFAEVHPWLNGVSRAFYLKSFVYAPNLYGLIYNATSGMKPDYPFGRLLHSMGKRKAKEVLEEIRPDVIIHTFPYLAASQLGRESAIQLPVFTVLTDYVLHGRWIHPHTTKYFIPLESIKEAMLSSGVDEQAITVSGIPIREAFMRSPDRAEVLRKHRLKDNQRYILLAGGAYGVMARIRNILKSVLVHTDFDFIVLCGNNDRLRESLEDTYRDNSRVHILGYTDDVHELMSISFCLLTKAGGVTLTEAFAMLLPVIVYRPLPGQEAGNAESLSMQKAIYTACNERELLDRLRRLGIQPFREEIERQMKAISRTESSSRIVDEVLNAIKERPSYAGRIFKKTEGKGKAKNAHGYR